MGHKQTTNETIETLDSLADRLKSAAESILELTEEMKRAGARGPIEVRHGVGLYVALRDTLDPFIADAKVKGQRAIAAAKNKPRK